MSNTSSALTPVRPIGNRAHRFGVAGELDLARDGGRQGGGRQGGGPIARPPVARPPVAKRRSAPRVAPESTADGVWARLCTWWAGQEVHPGELWHRLQCHFGRHQIEGGRQIQLGGRFVNTERCCVWCRHKPG
ncbi:MAG: hypothetical protein ACR2LJ_12860 [Acidimicrobiales bacterium]